MRPLTCHLLAAVDIPEPCPGEQCALWDEQCLVVPLRSDLPSNSALVRFLLGLREKFDDRPRPVVAREPGFD